jgi:hypothetical protein
MIKYGIWVIGPDDTTPFRSYTKRIARWYGGNVLQNTLFNTRDQAEEFIAPIASYHKETRYTVKQFVPKRDQQ